MKRNDDKAGSNIAPKINLNNGIEARSWWNAKRTPDAASNEKIALNIPTLNRVRAKSWEMNPGDTKGGSVVKFHMEFSSRSKRSDQKGSSPMKIKFAIKTVEWRIWVRVRAVITIQTILRLTRYGKSGGKKVRRRTRGRTRGRETGLWSFFFFFPYAR